MTPSRNNDFVKRPIDGIRPRNTRPIGTTYRRAARATSAVPAFQPSVMQTAVAASPAVSQIITIPPRRFSYKQPATKKSPWWQRFQLPLLIAGGMIGGIFAQTLTLGCAMLAVYGLAALIMRIPSRTTFILATLSLGVVSCMLLIKPNHTLISNFATYTFVLLIIGVIGLSLEARMPKRLQRKERPRP